MSGADWRQQEELEEQQWCEIMDSNGVGVCEFAQGRQARKDGGPIPECKSPSFIRGWEAQRELEETLPL